MVCVIFGNEMFSEGKFENCNVVRLIVNREINVCRYYQYDLEAAIPFLIFSCHHARDH